jgi:hypothetical protein
MRAVSCHVAATVGAKPLLEVMGQILRLNLCGRSSFSGEQLLRQQHRAENGEGYPGEALG